MHLLHFVFEKNVCSVGSKDADTYIGNHFPPCERNLLSQAQVKLCNATAKAKKEDSVQPYLCHFYVDILLM
jgi:hypothetical protein